VTIRTIAITCAMAFAFGAGLNCDSAAIAVERVSLHRLPESADSLPVATDVRVGGDDHRTRFVVDLTRKIDLAAFTLADPYRVVVDLPQVAFKLPAKAGEHGRGLVKAFRYGLIMQGGSRIVLDTKGPVRVDKAFVLDSAAGQPARLVLDLSATDRDSYLRNIEVQSHATPHIKVQRSAAVPESDKDPRPLIVLDPGHGGIDSGTKSFDGKVDEKDVVLAFGLELRKILERSGKYRVAMTRTDDTFVPLQERVRFARQHHASLFISIHADSVPRREGQAEGASVYTLSEKASDILVDLAQRETKTFSLQFARAAVNELKTTARLHKHPLKSAGFVVLKAPDVPSVLVELGYMSTKDDLTHLRSSAWRARASAALAEAVDTFFTRRLAGVGAEAN
jgi:N-acetylmuramoyl-L-alanine amidase